MDERWQLFPKWPRSGVTESSLVSKGDFLASVTVHFLPQGTLRLLRKPCGSKAIVKKPGKSQHEVIFESVNTLGG